MKTPLSLLKPILLALLTAALPQMAGAALLIHYKFDETSGNVATDSAVGNGAQNATALKAQSDWTGGIIGGGVNLSATGQTDLDEAFVHTSSTSLISGYAFSSSAWIKTDSTRADNRNIVYLGNQNASGEYHVMDLTATGAARGGSRNTTLQSAQYSYAPNADGWHHVLTVWASSTSRLLYVDGILRASNTQAVNNMSTTRFAVGGLMRNGQTDAFTGQIDDVGLWSNALTAVDVALIHGLGRYSGVDLGSSSIADVLAVFTNGTGSALAGDDTWEYATGLGSNTIGTNGVANGRAFIVLDTNGNGVVSLVPEPGRSTLLLVAALAMVAGRRRR